MSQLSGLATALRDGTTGPFDQFGRVLDYVRPIAVPVLLTNELDPAVLFTECAGGLRAHAGQISFPGGGAGAGETPVATALRGACEEVGLNAGLITVLGQLPTTWVPASGYEVTPVVVRWSEPLSLVPADSGEVTNVLQLRVSQLSDPATHVTITVPSGYRGLGSQLGDLFIWGITAHLLDVTPQVAG